LSQVIGGQEGWNGSSLSLGILVIEINLATSLSDQILDIRLYAHICLNMHALREMMILNRDEV
jgi:hypothetical protein